MGYNRCMRAGVAEIPFDLPRGIPMMGYGARKGVALSEHDPLHARALLLENGGRVLFVQLEVCLLGVPQAAALRARIARRTGIPAEAIWIAATHTHSGPETGLAQVLSGQPEPDHAEPIFAAAEEAAARACARAGPARIGLGAARAGIGRNRREAGGAVDEEIVVLRVDRAGSATGPAATGGTLAVAFVHGTHPTVLGHENLAWSADWPGAAGQEIRAAFPEAVPLFLLGAHGDVDPRTRGLQDLAIPDQSVGAGFEASDALGREAGAAVVEAARAIVPDGELAVASHATSVAIAVHGGEAGADARRRTLARRAEEAARALGLDPGEPLRISRVFAAEADRIAGVAPEEARERLARGRLFVRDRTAPRIAGGLRPAVELRVLELGAARWLGLPAEVTAELGLAWKRAHAPGSAVLSNVGGWLRYLPHPDRFTSPLGHQHYEVLNSTLEPGAALRLFSAAEALAGR